MLLTRLGVSLGEFECFPRHVSYQTPSNLSSSSPQPPSPGSSDCKPQVTHPMSFICLHTDRAALSHLRKGSGGPLEVPRSLSSIPQIPDLPRSIYLVTPWHCCEHLTTLSTSHTIMYLLSTSSSPRAAKIPVQILLRHKPHPAWDHPTASRMQGNAFLTSVLVIPCLALSGESIRHW